MSRHLQNCIPTHFHCINSKRDERDVPIRPAP
ncbi:hypothetical protein 22664B1_034 [Escherichia phage vB_EcoS-22664B1]|nr:hypothetical protein 22664B1_034 [Escherichia phage vB_EcoS-22664B1]QZI79023.1 hypothetical protein 101114B2_033 [Escherichia phage vB_EcoS-101114B2]